MNMLPNLKNLSVTCKISLGFAIVLLLHISIAAIGHYGLLKAGRDREKKDQLRAQAETFYEIDRLVSELQRNVLVFAYGGFKGPEEQALQLQLKLEQKLASTRKFDFSDDADIIKKMESHLAYHRESFDAVIVDRAKRRELVDQQLHQTGLHLNDLLDSLSHLTAEAEQDILALKEAFRSAQFHVMKYVHSPDSRYVRATMDNLQRVKGMLAVHKTEQDWPPEILGAVEEDVDNYERRFLQMIQATRGYLHLVNVVLAGHSQELTFQAKALRRTYLERASQLSSSIAADSDRFSLASNVFSVLTIVLGLIAARSIQKSISPALVAITETFDRLAKGETCTTIPGTDRQDELGRLATAAQVFHEQAMQTKVLLAEVNRMRDIERNHAHSQKLESLGQLASGIAHEINTPLQCVAANVEFLEESQEVLFDVIEDCCALLNAEPESQRDGLKQVQQKLDSREFRLAKQEAPSAASDAADAVRRVVDIISAMKSFSHPDGSRCVRSSVNQLIEGAYKLSRHHWKDHSDLELELAEDLPHTSVHPAEISQVLINLLVNASDAVQLNRAQRQSKGKIIVRTYATDDTITVEVQDNGPGIPESIQPRIFDPFFTTKDVGKGTGQGLSLVYDVIVRRHEGRIHFESDDQGTRFVLTIPVKRTPILCD